MNNKMKIEIWSDIVCPYCYIGKRKFETGLAAFADKDQFEVIWKSYQLMPQITTDTNTNVYDLIAKKYGVSMEESEAMHHQLTRAANQIGLTYNFDKAIPANTFKGHQLIHYAHTKGKQDAAEEALFKAYFTEGKNIDDLDTLLEIGASIDLDKTELKNALENGIYDTEVAADLNEAQQIGVQGVPFFVLDRKYAVSGAQDPNVYTTTIEKAFTEWRKDHPQNNFEIIDGQSCTPGEKCE